MNLCESLTQQVVRHRDRTAIERLDYSEPMTYGDLQHRVERVAAWLESSGVGENDHVAVYMPDCPAYIPLVFGIWHVGAVASPLNTRFGIEDLAFVLNDIRPTGMFTTPTFSDETTELADRIQSLQFVEAVPPAGDFTDFPPAASAPDRVKRMDDDTAIIMHTSGSTGDPKGVVQTHRNIGAQVESGISLFEFGPSDTSLPATPLFHVGGLHGATLMMLFAGGSVALLPDWDAADWARRVEEAVVTYTGLVPTMMVDVLNTDAIDAYDATSLRLCVFGGAPAPEPLLDRFRERFGVDLANYYGQTENAGVSVSVGLDDDLPAGALGKLTPAVRGTVVDTETGDPVAPGETGELLLQGDIITPGYWERPERNAELFTEGWLHTEDIVRQDEAGFLYYVDRKDDIIHSGGEKVPPSRVENVLQDMDGIEAVAVFGTAHERWGEAVTAAIVPASESIEADEVSAFCDDRDDLPGYMKPRRIAFVSEFPRTGSQKVDKPALADQIRSED